MIPHKIIYDYTNKLNISKRIVMNFVLSYEEIRSLAESFKKVTVTICVCGNYYDVLEYSYTQAINERDYHVELVVEHSKIHNTSDK